MSSELSEVQGVVLRDSRIVMPVSLRDHVIQLAHEGHQGVVKTKQRLRTKVWWPGIDKQAENYCKSCIDCMTVSQPDPPRPVSMTKFPDKPWSFLATDILGPLPTGQSIIVLIDYYSRYFECAFLSSTKSEKVIEFLDTVFARWGYCDAIRTDNGPQFVSEKFQSYLKDHVIKWVSTTPLWPQANGEVERVNRTLLKSLKIAHGNGKDLGSELRKLLIAYRSTPHSSTGIAPFTLLCAREMKTKIPAVNREFDTTMFEKAAENDAESKYKNKNLADKRGVGEESDIQVGDTVLVRNDKGGKLDANFSREKQTVVDKQGSEIVVANDEGKATRRNSTFFKVIPREPEASQFQNANKESGCQDIPADDPIAGKEPLRCSTRERKPPERYGNHAVHALGVGTGYI